MQTSFWQQLNRELVVLVRRHGIKSINSPRKSKIAYRIPDCIPPCVYLRHVRIQRIE